MLRRGAVALGAVAVVLLAWLVLSPPSPATISLRPSAQKIRFGQRVMLSGKLAGDTASARVKLYARPYPADAGNLVATVAPDPDGSFSFARKPDRDTSYYVQVGYGASSVPVAVDVDTRADIDTRPVPFGRAWVRVRVSHPPDLDWDDAQVHWVFAAGRDGHYVRSPATRTIRLRPDVVLLSAKVPLPPGAFRWSACFHAPGDRALEDPDRPRDCDGQGFSGRGSLPRATGFPPAAAIARAERYLSARTGHTALAVVNTAGRVSGVNLDEQFITGSAVKAMLLVAYLRHLDRMGQHAIDSSSNALLQPMIEVSDNTSATHVWQIVGDSGLFEVARAAGMTHFSLGSPSGTEWGAALLTARDQAEFFYEMDSLIPREFVRYARTLLSNIAPYASWGIPAVARPLGYDVFFKAGWRPSPDIFLVHQIARLEKDGHKFAVAVMTDGDPDMGYGIDTIQGTTRALLGSG